MRRFTDQRSQQDGAHLSPTNLSPLNVSHLTEVLTAF